MAGCGSSTIPSVTQVEQSSVPVKQAEPDKTDVNGANGGAPAQVAQSTTGFSPVQQQDPTPLKEVPAPVADPAPPKVEQTDDTPPKVELPDVTPPKGEEPTPPKDQPTPPKGEKPPVKPKPKPKPHKPVKGGGKPPAPKPPKDTTTVKLQNHDSNSEVKLTSSKHTSVEIFGDPHVRTVVDGKTSTFNIGYGAGSILLKDGTRVSWDTWHNASHALLNLAIDGPKGERDVKVSTSDGKDVENKLTNLTDAQLREFINKLEQYKGAWNQPLHKS
jgi:hypothetical protein